MTKNEHIPMRLYSFYIGSVVASLLTIISLSATTSQADWISDLKLVSSAKDSNTSRVTEAVSAAMDRLEKIKNNSKIQNMLLKKAMIRNSWNGLGTSAALLLVAKIKENGVKQLLFKLVKYDNNESYQGGTSLIALHGLVQETENPIFNQLLLKKAKVNYDHNKIGTLAANMLVQRIDESGVKNMLLDLIAFGSNKESYYGGTSLIALNGFADEFNNSELNQILFQKAKVHYSHNQLGSLAATMLVTRITEPGVKNMLIELVSFDRNGDTEGRTSIIALNGLKNEFNNAKLLKVLKNKSMVGHSRNTLAEMSLQFLLARESEFDLLDHLLTMAEGMKYDSNLIAPLAAAFSRVESLSDHQIARIVRTVDMPFRTSYQTTSIAASRYQKNIFALQSFMLFLLRHKMEHVLVEQLFADLILKIDGQLSSSHEDTLDLAKTILNPEGDVADTIALVSLLSQLGESAGPQVPLTQKNKLGITALVIAETSQSGIPPRVFAAIQKLKSKARYKKARELLTGHGLLNQNMNLLVSEKEYFETLKSILIRGNRSFHVKTEVCGHLLVKAIMSPIRILELILAPGI